MSAWAQSVLDASFAGPMADDAVLVPVAGGSAVPGRIYAEDADAALALPGYNAQPALNTQDFTVRKSEWPSPAAGDRIDVLDAPGGSVISSWTITELPLSLDPKRLTWRCVCLAA
jgi:hypothetical protein